MANKKTVVATAASLQTKSETAISAFRTLIAGLKTTNEEAEAAKAANAETGENGYVTEVFFNKDVYEEWIQSVFTKTICEARNRNQLMKAVEVAKELGLEEGKDFFLIKDCCLTELNPEEVDENGVGRTLTCIGFRPLPDELAHQISRKYQLYR